MYLVGHGMRQRGNHQVFSYKFNSPRSPWSSETHEKMKLATIGYSAVLTVLLVANCRAAGDVIC
ncbi:hypothetical protein PGTUg99_032831 [Puccinia graminis f. sp. tritici]|uniref:Uncharacterized protein n=1 Tax=Puccinia graminis f. sp. tritici TaxID=56615 RepID=A0A5B0P3F1_PUCGR|nr:hypothetical protein PGTUg99_032831 [Puccinia graminis f. sp. tritici]